MAQVLINGGVQLLVLRRCQGELCKGYAFYKPTQSEEEISVQPSSP